MEFNLKDVAAPIYTRPNNQKTSLESAKNNQKIIVIGSSGKGGTGKTTTAVNLALYYQDSGQKTVLLDFDTPYGDVANMLGINDDRCLTSWLDIHRPLIPEYANNMLMETESGLKVLPSIRNAKESEFVNSKQFAKMIFESLSHFDVIIVDAAPHFSELTLAAYMEATNILMISDPSIVSLTNIYRGMKYLREQKIDTSNTTLMVNRIMKKDRKAKNQYTRLTTIPDVIEVLFEPKMQVWMSENIFPLVDKTNSKYAKGVLPWAEIILPNLLEPRKNRFWG